MRIAVLYNRFDKSENKEVETELMETGKAVKKALDGFGHKVTLVNVDEKIFEVLGSKRFDFVFNVSEMYKGSARFEPHIAAVIEMCNIPYTGSGPLTLSLCMDKVKVKEILLQKNIPTPRFSLCTVDNISSKGLRFPIIIKPYATDNSIGITADSVVSNDKEFKNKVEQVISDYHQPVLAEEYIEGRELAVAVIGNSNPISLPISEIKFLNLPEGRPRIMDYELKWDDDYSNDIGAFEVCPAKVSQKIERELNQITVDAIKIMDIRDYGRVDFRLDPDGKPYVLEVNPNPGIYLENTIPKAAKSLGLSYDEMIHEILISAINRYGISYPFKSRLVGAKVKETVDDFDKVNRIG